MAKRTMFGSKIYHYRMYGTSILVLERKLEAFKDYKDWTDDSELWAIRVDDLEKSIGVLKDAQEAHIEATNKKEGK